MSDSGHVILLGVYRCEASGSQPLRKPVADVVVVLVSPQDGHTGCLVRGGVQVGDVFCSVLYQLAQQIVVIHIRQQPARQRTAGIDAARAFSQESARLPVGLSGDGFEGILALLRITLSNAVSPTLPAMKLSSIDGRLKLCSTTGAAKWISDSGSLQRGLCQHKKPSSNSPPEQMCWHARSEFDALSKRPQLFIRQSYVGTVVILVH